MMHTNAQLIHQFYTAFQQKDYKKMQNCYSPEVIFNDAVFVNLHADEVGAMWEMLLKRGKDLQLSFTNIEANDTIGSAEWTASYTFSQSGKKVVNHIKANFEFKDGKILRHTDQFSFYRWSRQALGPIGILMGWSNWLKQKVQTNARKNLLAFMQAQS